ncbi:MAG: nicotinate (nicotinamide) nucleotide adenylyltransferase [Bacteroides sp.]|nr:nicotinate (nicotinamide) nucleotide adenylyltransferase [Bacteroides sp.]
MIIGIYSGSFDPIHTGHAMVANYIGQLGIVDEVWLMVSRRNPLKEKRSPADDHHRMNMVSLVAKDCSGVKASDFELNLPLPSYTYVTLCKLRETYPLHRFKLIVGSDNWHNLGRWRDADKIIRDFGLIIYPRPGYPLPEQPPKGVELLLSAPTVNMSSSLIRDLLGKKGNINFFVPTSVAHYITEHNLYT